MLVNERYYKVESYKSCYFFLFIFNFYTFSSANEKTKIINKLNNIDNIQFKFTQTTNENIEKGKCILVFPNKLKCDYDSQK